MLLKYLLINVTHIFIVQMNRQTPQFYYGLLLFVAFLFFQSNLHAQIITKSYQIPKCKIFQFENDAQQIKVLTFDNAISTDEFPTLPAFFDKIEVTQFFTSYKYSLFNAKYESLTSEEADLIPSEYDFNEPLVDIKTSSDEGKFFAMLSFFPIIKNRNGQYQWLTSCEIRFEGYEPVSTAKRGVLKNSIIASGTWYKIAVNNTGLHKVTYNDLKKLGVPLTELRSSTIALFGNGGGTIPDINPEVQFDDLLECSIMIKDNGNDIFDENSYFVFYAQGPHTWEYNANNNTFKHIYNIYSDFAYYFINVDPGIGEKKRVMKENFNNQAETGTITTFTHYDFYEKDEKNFNESGREWFGEFFYNSSSKTFNFSLPELMDDEARLKIRVASTGTTGSDMDLLWSNNKINFKLVGGTSGANATIYEQNLPFSSGNLALTLKYNSIQSSGSAYLDYIEIQAKCKLKIVNNAMPFAITENIGTNNFSLVKVDNASAQTMIWDVTEHNAIYELTGTLAGTQLSFKTPTDRPRRFVAFNGSEYQSIIIVDKNAKVANQNLHGMKNVNMVIVSHPNFLSEANRLAQFREKESNLVVVVVTPEQIYNEFSSGAQDIAAIRNFIRYLYDNDAQKIQYLLLFGRPSYDYRGHVAGTQLFVPNYQSRSKSETGSVSTGVSCDDFFGILSFKGGSMNKDLINIAVGRFPVTTLAQAKIAVDKTINASVKHKITPQNASQVLNFGDWRNVITLVADDRYNGNFLERDAEPAAAVLKDNYPAFNLEKIYIEAYPVVSFAGGQRYPDATKAINMRMERGTLAISYMGHGGGKGWSNSRVLEITDMTNWKNKYAQPFMITITCSFGWYDKMAISPAEIAFLNENGGVSSMITTSRDTWSNVEYGKNIFKEIGRKQNNMYQTVGEIHKNAKGKTDDGTNMMYLIGDPAMKINVPAFNVKTDEILGDNLQKLDTLKALTKVTIRGRLTDDYDNTLVNFNGNIYPSIFDKPVKQTVNYPERPIQEFFVQRNVVFKGNATVKEGKFEFSFFVPKDINFEYGNGKISYYAASENEDAGDYYDNFIIGGITDKLIVDNNGPEIEIFLNDDKFVPGGITNPSPVLFLKLKDEYGINTTGNGVGHDLVAVLDDETKKEMILNDFYLANENSYNSGTVRYQLQDLAPGPHTIKVRAWDIFNNPSEASLNFVVKSDEKLKLDHVLNYPNPFTTKTSFYFEHNQPFETFDILIHIFTVSGKLVKTIYETQFLEGNRSFPIEWDGRDEYGDKIGKGVYLYRLTVRNSQGKTAEKIEKIAIL